jgi:hypothetical protein
MRFSAVFDPPMPMRSSQAEDRVQEAPVPVHASAAPAPWPPEQPPEDLDQRVRQVGEWQLEDW